MARIKRARRVETPLDMNKTRLPLAIKPSNNMVSHSSSSLSEDLSSSPMKIDIIQPLSAINQSSSPIVLAKETKLSSTTTSQEKGTTTKKTKCISKARIIEPTLSEEDDSESDTDGQYDLVTSIEESGGIQNFLETPCLILYKRNLTNQG